MDNDAVAGDPNLTGMLMRRGKEVSQMSWEIAQAMANARMHLKRAWRIFRMRGVKTIARLMTVGPLGPYIRAVDLAMIMIT